MKMNRTEWVIKVLNESAIYPQITLSEHQEKWLRDNVVNLNITVCVEDCVVDDIESVKERALVFIQDTNEFKKKEQVDTKKSALVLLPQIGIKGYILFWYVPKRNEQEQKVKIIYGINTTDDEWGRSSIKAYCSTYDIALRESQKHYDWWCSTPVGEEGIVPIKLIVE